MKKYTPKEFMDTLQTKGFSDTLMRKGMVKPVDGSKNKIAFSESQFCINWIEIPLEMIESIEYVQLVSCGKENYPYVHIYLKEPANDNVVAKVFASLVKLPQATDVKEQDLMKAFELFEEIFMEDTALRAGGGLFQPFANKYCDYVCEKCKQWENHPGPNKEFWCSRCHGSKCRR